MNSAALPLSPRLSPAVFGIVLAAHGLLFLALLREPSFELPPMQNVLSVRLLTPAAPQQPEAVQPVPRPVETPQPLRKLAPQPVPVETAAPAPAIVEPVAAAPEPVAAPPSETQPLFDADYLANPKPAYPALSRRLGEEGKVMLRVQVTASGLPLAVEVQAGSGSARLDQAALDAVRRWRFVPARRGSASVAATVLVPIVFSLKG